jgi:ABC-2 type transport system permease protein
MNRRLTIVLHELRVQLRSAPFVALLLLLIAATSTINPVAMIPGGSDLTLPVRAAANSVYALSPTFAMSGFFVYPFFAALMAGLSVLRDEEAGISELLHSTPLTVPEYVWAKFSGVVGALLIAILAHVVIVMMFRELAIGGVARAPFDVSAYLVGAALFVVPGVLWIAGVSFAVGTRTKSPMTVYAVPIAYFVLELVLVWNWHPRGIDPAVDTALMIVDPAGLRWLSYALFAEDRGIAWYNAAPLAIDWVLLASRLATLTLPLALVALVARGHGRRDPARVRRVLGSWSRAIRRVMVARGAPAGPASVSDSPISRSYGSLAPLLMRRRMPSPWRATGTVLAAELRSLVRSPSVYLFAAFLFAVVTEVGGVETDAYGSTPIVTAGGLAVSALPAVTVLTCLFLLFVIVESLYRDRATGFDMIAFSTPISTTAFVAGKALSAILLICVFTGVCVVSGGALLLGQSGPSVSWWPLLLVFGAVLAPTYILWTAFVTAVMSLVQSRTATLAVGFVALLLTAAQFMRGAMTWVTNWPLWGSLRWTEFAVFPLDGESLLLNRVLALGLAIAMFAAARWLFVRTERDRAAQRARRTPASVVRLVLRAAPLLALPVFTGAFLAVRVAEGFDGPALERAATAYEAANQHRWATVVPAVIRHMDVSIALEPSRRQLTVDGTYHLVNRTETPMTTLPFTVPFAFGRVTWSLRGAPTTPSGTDGLQVIALEKQLMPGDSVRVGFRYDARVNHGVSQNGGPVDAFVLPAGVLLSTHRGDFLPVPGYRRPAMAALRAVRNEQSNTDGNTDGNTDSTVAVDDVNNFFNRGWSFTATMRVRAPRALTVNAVGHRTASMTIDDETLSVWETVEPVSALNLVGAEYLVRRADGVAVYHHPQHIASLDVMVSTLAAARRLYGAWFHPYPWPELRLSEYADLSTQATSYPTNIAFSEGIGFLTRTGVDGGLAFAVTAHEVAHQWWGHLLAAGTGPGSGMLIEGMADYATLLLYDEVQGAASRRRYAALLEQQYLEGRVIDREQALIDTRESGASAEAVLQKKGAWAMWMLHQTLGATRTFAGLQEFISSHRAPGRFATVESMLHSLRRQTRDTVLFDANVAQWFRSTQLPSFALDEAKCQALAEIWSCTATLRNTGTGDATVDVAAMQGPRTLVDGTTQIRVGAGESTTVRWTLKERPDRLVVDPEVLVLQARRQQASAALTGR